MDWIREIDGYCERVSPEYWAEPINAITNAAFLISAWVMWQRVRDQDMPLAKGLVVILAMIGVGSYLFHTHARVWAALADVAPILLFILVYIFAVNRDICRMSSGMAICGTLLFLPFAALVAPLFQLVPGFGGSAVYAPVPLLILIYAFLLRGQDMILAKGMTIGALILILSITFRALDLPFCGQWPVGTHFMWHILNAIMLGWMIEVYRAALVRGRFSKGPAP